MTSAADANTPQTASRWKLMFSRLASNYGMFVVLVLLCIYCSLTTISQQVPTGETAAQSVAAHVSSGMQVMVVGRGGPDDQRLADSMVRRVNERGATVLERVVGTPADARAALERVQSRNAKLDAIVASNEAGSWGVFENLGQRFPSLSNTRLIVPESYRWPTFLNGGNLINVAQQVVVIAVLAIGMTIVIITGGIDLSVGSIVALSAVATAMLIARGGGASGAGVGSMLGASAIGILAGGVIGLVSGFFVTICRLPPFIATLGMMLIASSAAYQLSHGNSISDIPTSYTVLGQGASFAGIPNAVLLMVVLYAIAHFVMSTTVFGRYVYATGGNMEAARLSGVRVKLILVAAYLISGLTAGLGGVLVTSQLKAGAPTYGLNYELNAIAAVVVGGTSLSGGSGKILGTLIGAMIIAVIQNGMNLAGIESYMQKGVLGGVILVAAVIDTTGLTGRLFRSRANKGYAMGTPAASIPTKQG